MLRILAAVAFVALAVSTLPAQDGKKATLRWYGQSFFVLETPSGKRIAFDPHAIAEFGRPIVKADIVTCSHYHGDHTQTEQIENAKAARIFQGLKPSAKKGRPPEWNTIDEKVGQVRVRTVPSFHDPDGGMTRGRNAIFVIEADGLTVCHMGDIGHDLAPETVKAIGPVDVLMIPVGGIYTINGEQARKAVAKIKPRLFALPMHYGVPGYDELLPADEFVDGVRNVKKMPDTNELVIPLDAKPADGPTFVLLGYEKKDDKK